jgi:hypothetical protein
MSNLLYARDFNVDFTLIAIGIHYEGQPDTVWVIKDITNSPNFPIYEGQTYPLTEMGVANDLSSGAVDKIALKGILVVGSNNVTGWLMDGDPIDALIPPTGAVNFLQYVGNLALEDISNKKLLLRWGHSAEGGPVDIVVSDM